MSPGNEDSVPSGQPALAVCAFGPHTKDIAQCHLPWLISLPLDAS